MGGYFLWFLVLLVDDCCCVRVFCVYKDGWEDFGFVGWFVWVVWCVGFRDYVREFWSDEFDWVCSMDGCGVWDILRIWFEFEWN